MGEDFTSAGSFDPDATMISGDGLGWPPLVAEKFDADATG